MKEGRFNRKHMLSSTFREEDIIEAVRKEVNSEDKEKIEEECFELTGEIGFVKK